MVLVYNVVLHQQHVDVKFVLHRVNVQNVIRISQRIVMVFALQMITFLGILLGR